MGLGIAPWRAFLLWTGAIFLSILIHELGHCLAHRKHGMNSRMVLYHFGGLAIPSAWASHRSTADNPWSQLEISAAGPFLQMLSALAMGIVVRLLGYRAPSVGFGRVGELYEALIQSLRMGGGEVLPSLDLMLFAEFYTMVSVGWAVFNLLPIYPLDGGQIARSLGQIWFGPEGIRYSLMLSMVVGGFVAITSYQAGSTLMALMFASFAYSSYEALQSTRGSYRPW